MTRDDVIRLAREAGAPDWWIGWEEAVPALKFLSVFAALVAAAEREECAKVCEKLQPKLERFDVQRAAGQKARDCAEAILARGKQ